MHSLKVWRMVLAVLWVFAFLWGGFYFYQSLRGDAKCPVYIEKGSKSCAGAGAENIKEPYLLRSDITSPFGGALSGEDGSLPEPRQ